MRSKRYVLITWGLLVIMLAACGSVNKEEPMNKPGQDDETWSVAGNIVSKEPTEPGGRLLVYPSEEPSALEELSQEEWIEKAQAEGADIAWYVVDQAQYASVEVGQHVRMTLKPDQLEPYPPIRTVIDLEVTPGS